MRETKTDIQRDKERGRGRDRQRETETETDIQRQSETETDFDSALQYLHSIIGHILPASQAEFPALEESMSGQPNERFIFALYPPKGQVHILPQGGMGGQL